MFKLDNDSQERVYARVVKLYDKTDDLAQDTENTINHLSGNHHFDDTKIIVQEINKVEYDNVAKLSSGFNGVDWMIKSIMKHGSIIHEHNIP